jgi:hypothetical protein
MIKYAHEVSRIRLSDFFGNDGGFLKAVGGEGENEVHTHFHPPSLLANISIKPIGNEKAKNTIRILLSVVRGLAHYMNRVAKESTTGGVLYMPLMTKPDGNIFKIGDAIVFEKPKEVEATSMKENIIKKLKSVSIVDNPKTDLDIYRKVYYVWKATYYFGGAGTDPSGTSGNTMRLYITDSGIHWKSSYEEKSITTRVAENIQLHRLAVGEP